MSVLCTLTRKTREGEARWNFISDDSRFYAVNETSGKVISCKSREELRGLYRKFVAWNFSPLETVTE